MGFWVSSSGANEFCYSILSLIKFQKLDYKACYTMLDQVTKYSNPTLNFIMKNNPKIKSKANKTFMEKWIIADIWAARVTSGRQCKHNLDAIILHTIPPLNPGTSYVVAGIQGGGVMSNPSTVSLKESLLEKVSRILIVF